MTYRLTVNGERYLVNAAADTPLLYVLRNDLGLNGPKFERGLGQCGACAAIVGKTPARTCSVLVSAVGDDHVTTVEGLGSLERPHALQKALIEEQAAQCGYRSNGLIMAAKALLDANPRPTERDIRNALVDEASLGAGEGSLPPTSAALANAFSHATGHRIRELPMTPERVRRAVA
jgi:nicotinate dehydrogenase subunit A